MNTLRVILPLWFALVLLAPRTYAQNLSEAIPLPEGITVTGDTMEVRALVTWAKEHRQINPEQTRQVAQRSLTLAQNLDDQRGIGESSLILGRLTADSDQVERYLTIAQDAFEQLGDEYGLTRSWLGMGHLYWRRGELERSLELYFKALEGFERFGDVEGQAWTLNNIGITHKNLKNLEEAQTYYQRAFVLVEALDSPILIISILSNFGVALAEQGSYEQAASVLRQALDVSQTQGDQRSTAALSNNLAFVLNKQGHYEQALPFLLNAERLGNELQEDGILFAVYDELGKAYLGMGQYDLALHYANKGLLLTQKTETEIVNNQMAIHRTLAQIFAAAGNYEHAFLHHVQYAAARDSVLNTERTEIIMEMQTRYDTEEKERAIEHLEQQRQIQALQTSRWRIGVTAVMGSLLLLVGFLYNRYRLKQRANHLLEELDATKSRFFANISHELRTPLTVILGGLQDVLAGRFGEVSTKVAAQQHAMLRNTRRLHRLIDEVLDLNRLESGKLQLQQTPSDLVHFLTWLVEVHAPMAERKGVHLTFDADSERCLRLYDKAKLEKIVSNLLSNALKFTPQHGWVHLKLRCCDDKNIEISVEDNGPGIPAESQERIFERFVQIEDGALHGGTGIGLALAKELVELHGGTIRLESKPGKGSTFTVRLPLESVSDQGENFLDDAVKTTQPSLSLRLPSHSPLNYSRKDVGQDVQDWSPQSDTQMPMRKFDLGGDGAASSEQPPIAQPGNVETDQTTVLIIEDNDDVRAYVRRSLEETYRVLEATDGERGLQQARTELPDLIVSDVMLPGIDGYGIARRLKAEPATECIPLVMLTARVAEEDHVEGYSAGAEIYITKPFSPETLYAAVARLLEERQRLRRRLKEHAKADEGQNDVHSTLLDRIRTKLLEHLHDEDFGVEELASVIGMSRYTLHRHVKQETGLSPSDLVRTLRLEHAHELLSNGAGSVSEVAYAVGFKSLSHFTHSFQKHYGKLPSNVLGQRTDGAAQ